MMYRSVLAWSVGLMLTLGVSLEAVPRGRPPSVQTAKPQAKVAASKRSKCSTRARRSVRRTHRRRGPSLPAGPSPERIGEIQQALGRAGFYTGEPSGKWDAATIEAMKEFQKSQGLEPTGKLDALSLQKLGLGSDVANLAAPRPALPPPSKDGKGQGVQ